LSMLSLISINSSRSSRDSASSGPSVNSIRRLYPAERSSLQSPGGCCGMAVVALKP
jgi:hypothetical protein